MAHGRSESGWGRLKTEASYLDTKWSTSLWFDTKSAVYLLPLTGKIRRKYKLQVGDLVEIELKLDTDFLL
jgi:hypothetical protein